jgi:hypothetical protein
MQLVPGMATTIAKISPLNQLIIYNPFPFQIDSGTIFPVVRVNALSADNNWMPCVHGTWDLRLDGANFQHKRFNTWITWLTGTTTCPT